jgi:hypothetical protein
MGLVGLTSFQMACEKSPPARLTGKVWGVTAHEAELMAWACETSFTHPPDPGIHPFSFFHMQQDVAHLRFQIVEVRFPKNVDGRDVLVGLEVEMP